MEVRMQVAREVALFCGSAAGIMDHGGFGVGGGPACLHWELEASQGAGGTRRPSPSCVS
ncbi:hypothetical protein K458DRAFT_17270 [Lentithecium fluviatile CBS 122367]|uniref:Uncharacterized protein n=1 Tax=Lentithecium fluviatile CBS 122367 TaxID=1168545 RepID=A0A6G1J5I3_9PLEO|nr:hypothetical protein K458DRAFT_17270 [Lentithecium fluviatile CBS 122367]